MVSTLFILGFVRSCAQHTIVAIIMWIVLVPVHLTIQNYFVCKKMSLSFGRRSVYSSKQAFTKSLLVIILLFNLPPISQLLVFFKSHLREDAHEISATRL